MEGRCPAGLHLEMSDLDPAQYRSRRGPHFGAAPMALFTNLARDREDLPRTLPDFDLLAIVEIDADLPEPPPDPDLTGSYRFLRTPRPGQGSLAGDETDGLELVLISPKDPERAQELRDWADFVHIRHIAEAAVPGFRMITPYVRARGEGPRFLHLYEMHTHDAEAAFQQMTPLVADALGGPESDAFREWSWHDQLRIDYVNTFRRVAAAPIE